MRIRRCTEDDFTWATQAFGGGERGSGDQNEVAVDLDGAARGDDDVYFISRHTPETKEKRKGTPERIATMAPPKRKSVYISRRARARTAIWKCRWCER